MEIAELIDTLRAEGGRLAAAAERAGFRAPVPTCPGWRVRDLVRHTGMVHRWATGFVAQGLTSPRRADPEPDLDGSALLAWFRDGHRDLADALAKAPADLDCWAFLPAPSPLAFWARRQAHETTVHRVDAESALGGERAPIGTAFALDGIDELLRGFHARKRSRVRTEAPRTLRIRATDAADGGAADGGTADGDATHGSADGDTADGDAAHGGTAHGSAVGSDVTGVWTVRLSGEPARTDTSGTGPVDCEIAGPAPDLYLALWNRLPAGGLRITGDAELARLWREHSPVVWS